jgi:hypothetical protein
VFLVVDAHICFLFLIPTFYHVVSYLALVLIRVPGSTPACVISSSFVAAWLAMNPRRAQTPRTTTEAKGGDGRPSFPSLVLGPRRVKSLESWRGFDFTFFLPFPVFSACVYLYIYFGFYFINIGNFLSFFFYFFLKNAIHFCPLFS